MKSSYLKRVLITAALVLVGVGTALAPAAPAIAHHPAAVAGDSGTAGDDTPWG